MHRISEVVSPERCAVDGWLRNTSKTVRPCSLFALVERAHCEFHAVAAKTIERSPFRRKAAT
ncbi:MAG: hypothetical protein ACXWC5_28720 [Burkholderiales bacterium]